MASVAAMSVDESGRGEGHASTNTERTNASKMYRRVHRLVYSAGDYYRHNVDGAIDMMMYPVKCEQFETLYDEILATERDRPQENKNHLYELASRLEIIDRKWHMRELLCYERTLTIMHGWSEIREKELAFMVDRWQERIFNGPGYRYFPSAEERFEFMAHIADGGVEVAAKRFYAKKMCVEFGWELSAEEKQYFKWDEEEHAEQQLFEEKMDYVREKKEIEQETKDLFGAEVTEDKLKEYIASALHEREMVRSGLECFICKHWFSSKQFTYEARVAYARYHDFWEVNSTCKWEDFLKSLFEMVCPFGGQ